MKNKMTTILSTLIATVAMAKVAEPPENIVPAPMPVIRVSDLRKNEKSVKVEPQDIVQDLILAYGTYQDTKAELAAKQEEITKAIKAIIRKFTL